MTYKARWITLAIPPSVNHYIDYSCTRSTPGDVHPIKARVTPRAEDYKAQTGWLAKEAGVRVEEHSAIKLEVKVYQRDTKRDLDNMLKVLVDALINIAFSDDRQIAEIHMRRYKTRKRGSVKILITNTEEIEEDNEDATERLADTRRKMVRSRVRGFDTTKQSSAYPTGKR